MNKKLASSVAVRSAVAAFALVLGFAEPALASGGGATLDSVTPNRQRVYDMITLRGSGFGPFQAGVSHVAFLNDNVEIVADKAYVWRDDVIILRVPVGDRIGGNATPIPKTPLEICVVNANGLSNTMPFEVITAIGADMSFIQRTNIIEEVDQSGFFGPAEMNLARTKDADIGDANGDGLPDIIDNNSNNQTNGTHAIVHFNLGGNQFTSRELEPVNENDTGNFLTTVDKGGDYVGDAIMYDADFVDLNNDFLPDIVQAAAAANTRMRVLINNHNGQPGRFHEETDQWVPNFNFNGSPDDIEHWDVNHDGFVDVAVALRFNAEAKLFINGGGSNFSDIVNLDGNSGSMHDVFFIDANKDSYMDAILVNESGNSRLLFQDGATVPTFTLGPTIFYSGWAGVTADFNGDGVDDFGLSSSGAVAVFLNDPDNPGNFQQVNLSGGDATIYDIEAGDINLDGRVDIVVAAIISDADDSVDIWLNDGNGTSFTNITSPGATAVLPGHEAYQRLSADLIDFDLDGDLDLYVTGADGQDIGHGFGVVANQFFENILACRADLDGDGAVGSPDLIMLLGAWGPCGACDEDLDGDGQVGTPDLLLLLGAWGTCA